jgi:hypothetical protein
MVQSISKSILPTGSSTKSILPYIWYQSQASRLIRGRGRRRRKKKGEGGVGLRPYLDLLTPSTVDPQVVDLRAARVEPDHRSSVCGRALDLAGAPLLDLRRRRADACHLVGASERVEAPQRPLDGGGFTQR